MRWYWFSGSSMESDPVVMNELTESRTLHVPWISFVGWMTEDDCKERGFNAGMR